MNYLVIKRYDNGECFICSPNKLLTLEEAASLRDMLKRTENSYKIVYSIAEIKN